MKSFSTGCLIGLMYLFPMHRAFSNEKEKSSTAVKSVPGPQNVNFTLAAISKRVWSPSAAVRLALNLKNVGSASVRFAKKDGPNAARDYRFSVLGPNKQEMPLTLYGRNLLAKRRTLGTNGSMALKPGEEVVDTIPLNRLFDMTLSGTYLITASTTISTGSISTGSARLSPSKARDTVVLTSNVLEIEIREGASSEEDEKSKP